ncbi:MAG TPA: hypothetical protein VK610_09580, partial [Rhodothermales bacterium]|nr:hypothetical protein [Rhodothermales bacterium]
MAYRFASRRAALLALIVGACLAAPAAWAQHETIVVNDPDDGSDFAAPQTVAQLPGPDGHVTLREAVAAANNTPGPQTIHFQIPQSAWFSVYPDRATVFVYINPYILTDDSTTIDGRSQTLFSGDTNPNGNEVAFWGEHPNAAGSPLFIVHSDGNTFAGLDAVQRRGYGITLSDDAEGNRVIANTISGPLYAAVQVIGSHNTVGGILPGEGNRLTAGNDGVRVESAFETPPPTGNR